MASWGGFARFFSNISTYPEECDSNNKDNWAAGAYAGVGFNLFFTNAEKASDLSGPAKTFSINLGLKWRVFAIQFTKGSNGKWILSYGGPMPGVSYPTGVGLGVSVSYYNTITTTKP